MFKPIASTQGYYRSIKFQVSTASREGLQPLSFICCGSEPFRPVEHLTVHRRWNILANKSGDSTGELCNSDSDLPQFFNSCPNPGSFSNSLQSDLLSDLVYLGLKLPNLFRSELFRSVVRCFHTQFNSIFPDLVFFCLDPSFFLCFGHLQGTAPMLCMRSGATAWTKWIVHGATAYNLMTRSGTIWETLCQHLRSVVPGRNHSKALFPYFSLQKFGFWLLSVLLVILVLLNLMLLVWVFMV